MKAKFNTDNQRYSSSSSSSSSILLLLLLNGKQNRNSGWRASIDPQYCSTDVNGKK